MDNKERLRKWLWLGLDETTAKKYQRKLSAENVRIIRNESVIIAGIGALYTICMLVLSHVYVKSLVCIIGAAWMFCIFLYTHSLLKKQDEISKQETYASIGSFMICAMLYLFMWEPLVPEMSWQLPLSVCLYSCRRTLTFCQFITCILPLLLWQCFLSAVISRRHRTSSCMM